MNVLQILTTAQIVEINKYICKKGGNPYHCFGTGKIESALHTAFYPGTFQWDESEIPRLAGALCFYLVKCHAFEDGNKRTGTIAAITFMNLNGWDLKYLLNSRKNINELAAIINQCAASEINKKQLEDWFEAHKVKIESR